MPQGIHKAAAGMMAGMDRFGTIANNLANASTTGYKRDLQFLRLLTREQSDLERKRLGGASVRELVQDQFTDFSQGELNETGNRLDLAISGEGLFTIQTTKGIAYTRNGSFTLDEESYLVDYLGNRVLSDGGEILINGAEVIINRFGEVEVDGGDVGKLKIVVFEDNTKLRKAGNSLFYPINQEVKPQMPTEPYLVSQGYLETSNVNLVQ
ncbi:MAG: flagellar hook-basal body protein, partial [Bacteroidetes bacterium]|nr:flagellar hook-basal body protein [Bacteroidota bacterium]